MMLLDPAGLKKLMTETLVDLGVLDEAAIHVAKSLVTTSLRGVDSHGVNLFPHYVRAVKAGRIKSRPNMRITQTGQSAAKLDADHAFGHYSGSVAMAEAVKLALVSGVGAVAVSNSTHFGAAAYFALQATRADCIGMAFTNADALVKAHNAVEAFFGTNPICFAAPLQTEEPFCLDMATSLVSWNRILNYRRDHKNIPTDWAFDRQGIQTDNPDNAVTLNPAGSYKGFGLGMMIDVLCALFASGPVSKDILPMYSSPIHEKRKISHFFMALSIRHFVAPAVFRTSLQQLVERVRNMSRLCSSVPVVVAGDPEKLSYKVRLEEGIPIDEKRFDEFINVNKAFSDLIIL